MKAMAFPLEPPSSISCRALSAPIDRSAASAAEKKAATMKQKMRAIISKVKEKDSSGGSMKRSLLS